MHAATQHCCILVDMIIETYAAVPFQQTMFYFGQYAGGVETTVKESTTAASEIAANSKRYIEPCAFDDS